MHDDHPPNKPAGQLATAPRIRRLRLRVLERLVTHHDSSAHTEIKGSPTSVLPVPVGQLRAYGD